MTLQLDLRVVELLASRLCHDLISPIGAVNNGMELLEESPDDPETVTDAVGLAGGSARQASTLLQFYRIAYGQAGRRGAGGTEDLLDLARGYAKARKSEIAWPVDERWADVGPEAAKLTLNMIALGAEALPRGGTLTVALSAGEPALPEVHAAGRSAGLGEGSLAALGGSADPGALTPHTVHAYFTARLAETLGGSLSVATPEDGRVVLRTGARDSA
jgi:histidine phosphotransferase ChpT